jgi:hypothetical protein
MGGICAVIVTKNTRVKKRRKKVMGRYAVQIEIEKGEYTFVRKENPWTYDTKVWVFTDREEAEKEAKRWNTGVVVEYL